MIANKNNNDVGTDAITTNNTYTNKYKYIVILLYQREIESGRVQPSHESRTSPLFKSRILSLRSNGIILTGLFEDHTDNYLAPQNDGEEIFFF